MRLIGFPQAILAVFFPNNLFNDLLIVTSAPVTLEYNNPDLSCRSRLALIATGEFLLTDMLR